MESVGHGKSGPLQYLFWGHTASAFFMNGWKTAQLILHSWSDPVVRHGWSAKRTHGPVLLARRWMERQGWETLAPWIWRHKHTGDVVAPPGAIIPRRAAGHQMSAVYRLFPDNTEELGHVLREAWRACCWSQCVAQNNRGREISDNHWFSVRPYFLETRKVIQTIGPDCRAHAVAVISGHFMSPAAYDPELRTAQSKCPNCHQETVPSFHHMVWECSAFATTRPQVPTAEIQKSLGWSDPALSTEANRRILCHMAEVRATVVAQRREASD